MSAKNHNAGKPKWSLLLTDFADELREVLRVREVIEASGKYDRMNFAQSQGKPEAKVFLEDNLDSIERHLFDRRKNKHIDHETKCYHMAHLCIRSLIDLSYALHDSQTLATQDCEDILHMVVCEGSESEDPMSNCDTFDLGEVVKKSRFPWKDAPEWATCAAIDSDSYGTWYAERPEPNDRQWISDYRLARIGFKMLRDGEDWRTTIEERPS